jgi:hypothetical protein
MIEIWIAQNFSDELSDVEQLKKQIPIRLLFKGLAE